MAAIVLKLFKSLMYRELFKIVLRQISFLLIDDEFGQAFYRYLPKAFAILKIYLSLEDNLCYEQNISSKPFADVIEDVGFD